MEFTHTLTIDNEEVEVEVEFSISDTFPGTYFTPPEGGEIEDLSVYDLEGNDVYDKLTKEQISEIEQKCFDHADNQEPDEPDYEDYAERKRERQDEYRDLK